MRAARRGPVRLGHDALPRGGDGGRRDGARRPGLVPRAHGRPRGRRPARRQRAQVRPDSRGHRSRRGAVADGGPGFRGSGQVSLETQQVSA